MRVDPRDPLGPTQQAHDVFSTLKQRTIKRSDCHAPDMSYGIQFTHFMILSFRAETSQKIDNFYLVNSS